MANERRLIDVNALCDLLDVEYERKMKLIRKGENHLDTLAEGIMSMSVLLGTMPTVDAVEVVHGRWVWISDSVVSCTHCGRDFYSEDDVNAGATWFYCPKCGAKMDGDGNA